MNKKKRIAINGFGRIGRALTKINLENFNFELVLINDINPNVHNMSYLYKYDSTYGNTDDKVSHDKNHIIINDNKILYLSESSILDIDWKKYDVDCIIDSSGVESNVLGLREILDKKFAKKGIITHSSNLVDNEIIVGINDDEIKPNQKLFSSSICDANAISHVLKYIDSCYKIQSGSVTTVHPWLSYQNLVDGPSKSQITPGKMWTDFSLGRASNNTLIPKKTTAVSATEKVLSKLKDKLLSFSYRVPTDIVSGSDITIIPKNIPSKKQLVDEFENEFISNPLVELNYDSKISLDYKKNNHSCIIDMQWLNVKNGIIKVIVWYDNEWGYSSRVLDLAKIIS